MICAERRLGTATHPRWVSLNLYSRTIDSDLFTVSAGSEIRVYASWMYGRSKTEQFTISEADWLVEREVSLPPKTEPGWLNVRVLDEEVSPDKSFHLFAFDDSGECKATWTPTTWNKRDSQTLLQPGEYTIRGTANGCRDLYMKIEVIPGIQPVDLTCKEPL